MSEKRRGRLPETDDTGGTGDAVSLPAKPRRSKKTAKEAAVQTEELQGMSAAWRRFYEAVNRSVK